MDQTPVTSPELPVDDRSIVKSTKDFVGALTLELSDEEIGKAFQIVEQVRRKFCRRIATRENLEELGDETITRLAEIGILAQFDPTTVLAGQPPTVEFIGKVAGDPIHKHGMDHERKGWEVRRATERGEQFYGEEKTRTRLD